MASGKLNSLHAQDRTNLAFDFSVGIAYWRNGCVELRPMPDRRRALSPLSSMLRTSVGTHVPFSPRKARYSLQFDRIELQAQGRSNELRYFGQNEANRG